MAGESVFSPNLEDKVFLVTGGAAGVGAAVVRSLLSENARFVAFLDIAEREGSSLENELTHNFGALRAKFIKCDIADEQQLTEAYRHVLYKFSRLDGVINNAAVLRNDEHYAKMIGTNFTATVSSTMKAIDILSTEKGGKGGVIVNVASQLALQPTSHLPVYGATKTAVFHFSSSIAAQLESSNTGVRVITVCLGPTDTAILERQNLKNFDNDSKTLTSRVSVRQRVESAANGIVEAIKNGDGGSIWVVADDKPAVDVTTTVAKGYQLLSESLET